MAEPLNCGTLGFPSQILLCWPCPVHCRPFAASWLLPAMDQKHFLPLYFDTEKHLMTLLNVPWGYGSPLGTYVLSQWLKSFACTMFQI